MESDNIQGEVQRYVLFTVYCIWDKFIPDGRYGWVLANDNFNINNNRSFMKKILFVVIMLFAVNLFAQTEINDATGLNKYNLQKREIQQQAQQLQSDVQQKLNPLKVQIYDAQKLIESNEKQIAEITNDYAKQMAELQKKFDAITEQEKAEKKDEVKK